MGETKVQDLENKRDGACKFGRIFQAMIDKYTSCHGFGVGWEEPNAPIIDPAPPRTVNDNVDNSYNTNEKIVDVEDSYNTSDKLVEVDDSYNTNDKIVEVDDAYNTNDKLVETGDSYNTNEKIVDQSTPVTCASPPAAKITEDAGDVYVAVDASAVDLREDDPAGGETQQY